MDVNSLNFGYSIGKLSVEQCRGIISLLSKKDKDRLYLTNWRPISLLNMDYKIGAKVLAKRIQPLLTKLINPNQSGYVKGRYIGENIRNIIDIMQYTDFQDIPGLILLIDFEKAYDSLEWNYIDEALEARNFGPQFRNWVKTLYCSSKSCVINNGYASEFFSLEKSVRQGCPLAPFLFIVVIEVLAEAIRNDNNIKGIKVEDKEVKISQLADDTTCFLSDEDSANKILEKLELFSKISGLKCNRDKTEAIWIGQSTDNPDGNVNVKWKTKSFSTLGVTFCLDENEMCDLNMNRKIANIKNIFNVWKRRDLTLIGRILITKVLGLSQINYLAQNIYITENQIQSIQQEVNCFIWKKGKPKVKMKTVTQNIENGGLKFPHIDTQIRAFILNYIKRIVAPENQAWKAVLQTYIPCMSLVHLPYTRCHFSDEIWQKLPNFYRNIFRTWQEMRSSFKPNSVEDTRRESLWFNPFIKINNASVFYKKWYKHGIFRINDIVDENGILLLDSQLEEKYGFKMNFLEYYSLRHAIPFEWLTKIKNCQSLSIELTLKLGIKPLTKWCCKDFYWYLLPTDLMDDIAALKKWQTLLSNNELDWSSILKLPFQNSMETRIQSFQYSIINRFVPHNKYLQLIGIKESNICVNCNNIDSVLHRFVQCQNVRELWKDFIDWWNVMNDTSIVLNDIDIIFGVTGKCYALNNCILLAKYHIHASLCKETTYSFKGCLGLIKKKIEMEKYILIKGNNTNIFNERWGNFISMFTST